MAHWQRLDGANATITTTLDTRPLYAWTGPTAALSQLTGWANTEPGALAHLIGVAAQVRIVVARVGVHAGDCADV